MTRDTTRQLSLAASSRKIGYAFFVGRELADWGTARKASHRVDDAHAQAIRWIDYYVPARMFIEEIDDGSRKGPHARAVIRAFRDAGEACAVPVFEIARRTHHQSRYFEAIALAEKHPLLAPWVPKRRRYYSREPMQMSMFEAVSLVEEWYAVEARREAMLSDAS